MDERSWAGLEGPGDGRRPATLALLTVGVGLLFSGCRGGPSARRGPVTVKPGPAVTAEQPETISELREEVQRNPSSPGAHARLADEYLRHNRLREAHSEYTEALSVDRGNPKATQGMAALAARLDSKQNALAVAQAAAAKNPGSVEAANTLGVAQALAGKGAEALRTFEQALKQHPKELTLLLNAAAAAGRLKQWKKAEAYCERAVAAAPGSAGPRQLLAALYAAQGKNERAVAELERLAREHPDSAASHYNLARARLAENRKDEALAGFKKAAELKPEWVLPHLEMGVLKMRQNAPAEAEPHFQKALELEPKSVVAMLGMAQLAEGRGQKDDAIQHYEKMLTFHPNMIIALNNLAYHLGEQGKEIDRALELARRAAAISPQVPDAWDTLGWVCYRAGRHDEAVRHLEKAARLAPKRGQFHYHLAKALHALGKREQATASFKTALSHPLPDPDRKDAEASLAASGG